jgi:large repetitive protein
VVDAVSDTASSVADVAEEAASDAGAFVVEHEAEIAGIAAGVAVYAGCTAASGGAGVVACSAVVGAAGSAVTNALDEQGDHSRGGYVKSMAGGAAMGVFTLGAGKALAPVAKRLAAPIRAGASRMWSWMGCCRSPAQASLPRDALGCHEPRGQC